MIKTTAKKTQNKEIPVQEIRLLQRIFLSSPFQSPFLSLGLYHKFFLQPLVKHWLSYYPLFCLNRKTSQNFFNTAFFNALWKSNHLLCSKIVWFFIVKFYFLGGHSTIMFALRGRRKRQCELSHIVYFIGNLVDKLLTIVTRFFVRFIKVPVLLKISVLKKLYLVG